MTEKKTLEASMNGHLNDVSNFLLDNPSVIAIVFGALITAISSYFLHRSQKKHDIRGIQPLPHFSTRNGKIEVAFDLVNNGLGPLKIKDAKYINKQSNKAYMENEVHDYTNFLMNYFDDGKSIEPRDRFNNFAGRLIDHSVPAKSTLRILGFSRKGDTDYDFDTLRERVKNSKVILKYTDIYDSETWTIEEDFKWLQDRDGEAK